MRISPSALLSAFVLVAAFSILSFAQGPLMGPPPTDTPGNERKIEPAKEPCRVTFAELPPIAGLQIGSSYEEALALYPEIANNEVLQKQLAVDGSGVTPAESPTIFGEMPGDKPYEIMLFFTSRNVAMLSVANETDRYQTIKEAVSDFSRILRVEETSWTISGDAAAMIECVDFAFFVNSRPDKPGRRTTFNIHTPRPAGIANRPQNKQ